MTTRFPDWESLYKNNSVESMPWFNKELDLDLARELKKRNLAEGKFLDLGTGPGTQASELAKMGFSVIGTDISEAAIKKASLRSTSVDFVVDNILATKLQADIFDYVFDRGCFHVLSPDTRGQYIRNIKKILKNNGLLFLKCFSTKEVELTYGPYRFSQEDLKKTFGREFKIESIFETEYQGTLKVFPKALFAVLKK